MKLLLNYFKNSTKISKIYLTQPVMFMKNTKSSYKHTKMFQNAIYTCFKYKLPNNYVIVIKNITKLLKLHCSQYHL